MRLATLKFREFGNVSDAQNARTKLQVANSRLAEMVWRFVEQELIVAQQVRIRKLDRCIDSALQRDTMGLVEKVWDEWI